MIKLMLLLSLMPTNAFNIRSSRSITFNQTAASTQKKILSQQVILVGRISPSYLPSTLVTTLRKSTVLDGDNDMNSSAARRLRNSLRALTGFSLTATRASLRAATGVSISGIFKVLIGLFPTWLRWLFQPLLVMYYTPLIILKMMVGHTKTYKSETKATHEVLVDGWKSAVKAAEAAHEAEYWPVRVTDDGFLEVVAPPDPTALGVRMDIDAAIVQDTTGFVDIDQMF